MSEVPEPWDTCQGQLQAEVEAAEERSVSRSAKLEGKSHKSPLTLDKELQHFEFALLGFSVALAQCFIRMPHFLSLEILIFIPCVPLCVGSMQFAF